MHIDDSCSSRSRAVRRAGDSDLGRCDHRRGVGDRDVQPVADARRDAVHPRPVAADRADPEAALRRGRLAAAGRRDQAGRGLRRRRGAGGARGDGAARGAAPLSRRVGGAVHERGPRAAVADARLPRRDGGRGARAGRPGRDRSRPLGHARRARRPAPRPAARDGPRLLALPGRAARCSAGPAIRARPFRARTAVPYAQISVHMPPISEVSKRMATMAFAPFASASATIRSITSWRLATSAFVMPFSSPPSIDLRLAPICEPTLRERTVRPITSP